jgi:hypothetical protein
MTDIAEVRSRFDRVLRVVKDVVDSMTALDLAFEEMKKGVEGAYASAAVSCSKARRAFEDETPTMDALAISLKDHQYKDPTWPQYDDSSDPQTLRFIWYVFHNLIVAGKSFTPDHLVAMRNLYAALERARERLVNSLGSKSPKPKFEWRPAMLEGYVAALLRVVKYPTQREAVAWIAEKARQREPSTTTLRKTYGWRNRRKKIAEPRTTNEAQSGVSPVQNAATVVSHVDVTNAVVDIEDSLGRQLADEERDAVAWTIENAGTNEEEQKQAIDDLIQGFRSGVM